MKLQVKTLDNKSVGEVDLREDIFGLPERLDILQRVVEWQRAKRQAGTHKTKTVGEISGTTKKMYKQKGTGSARHGSRRAAQFVGGQTTFGPVVRSHAYKLNKKFRVLGLKTALSVKCAGGMISVVEDLEVGTPKTKELNAQLQTLGFVKPLIVDVAFPQNFSLAVANIKNTDIISVEGINVYDILRHKELVITKRALSALEGRLV
ncbi:MAG: 50S ribosomal protein L4 [Alphaproteobacteria bacterium]|nr:MAG: 50S ribosomal protein L4 [Alphaproteobacteria bacterium]